MEFTVQPDSVTIRLDKFLSNRIQNVSRVQIQQSIIGGEVFVNGLMVDKNRHPLISGDEVQVRSLIQSRLDASMESPNGEDMQLDIVFEDEDLLVLNKPADLIVHPGAGNYDGTLLNGLLNHHEFACNLARAGIVHRLDKDTSGLMVVAKNHETQNYLIKMIAEREVKREYQAITVGIFNNANYKGRIETQFGRSRANRIKMAVRVSGKEAITDYELLTQYPSFAHVCMKLQTGRTHQIRVHMQHLGYPIVGDVLYGKQFRDCVDLSATTNELLQNFSRQALHAYKLSFMHPKTKKNLRFKAKLPDDMQGLIKNLDMDLEAYLGK